MSGDQSLSECMGDVGSWGLVSSIVGRVLLPRWLSGPRRWLYNRLRGGGSLRNGGACEFEVEGLTSPDVTSQWRMRCPLSLDSPVVTLVPRDFLAGRRALVVNL